MPFILLLVLFHVWGTSKNRRKAKQWIRTHAPVLQSEFAVVGFGGVPKLVRRGNDGGEIVPGSSDELVSPDSLLKEKSPQEFVTYATGRQNVAFLDVALKLPKRYNPITFTMEYVFSFFFESWPAPSESVEALSYGFDGKEKALVPTPSMDPSTLKVANSTYDGFIWAVVHKSHMRKIREDRYDVSMTFTKDNAKLPPWVTVMTENAEITDLILTPELITAIEKAGDALEFLIITDQPVDKPTK